MHAIYSYIDSFVANLIKLLQQNLSSLKIRKPDERIAHPASQYVGYTSLFDRKNDLNGILCRLSWTKISENPGVYAVISTFVLLN